MFFPSQGKVFLWNVDRECRLEASNEEEVANLCLVAKEDGEEETLSDFESVHGDEVSMTDLQEAYNDVHREFHE